MSSGAQTTRTTGLPRRALSVTLPRWSVAAWASGALAAVFIAVSCWWLAQDASIPVDDAGTHLSSALDAYSSLAGGHLLKAFTVAAPYPPMVFLAGALGVSVGGVGVAPPIIAENLVFLPLLVLGCYNVGRLAFGRLAGALAVVFALGCPLVVEEFHELMLDAPEAAMVAVSVWAILASERFSRPGVSLLAGVTVGVGMLTKETFPFFIAGVALTAAVRGGPRAWRGIALFAGTAVLIAAPWYVYEFSRIHELTSEALGSSSALASKSIFTGVAPPRLSAVNLTWYFWSTLNWLLYLPLLAFVIVGTIWTGVGFARRRPVSALAPELAIGALVSWAALTGTYVHDPRYSIPMLVYLAVFGAGWLSRLARPAQVTLAATLVLIALANTLGVGFGVGGTVKLGANAADSYQQQDTVTFYGNLGLWVSKPTRDGDLLGLLRALRRAGVREVRWLDSRKGYSDFSDPGIAALARIAGLGIAGETVDPTTASRHDAFLTHGLPAPGFPRPCTTLADHAGVWVKLGGTSGTGRWSYCPLRVSRRAHS